MTSCSALADIEYNSGTVDTVETTIVYRTGNFGWGYYGPAGRFYGPNYINYYTPIYGPRIIVPPTRRVGRTVVTPTRRGRTVVRRVPRQPRTKVQRTTRGTGTNRGRATGRTSTRQRR